MDRVIANLSTLMEASGELKRCAHSFKDKAVIFNSGYGTSQELTRFLNDLQNSYVQIQENILNVNNLLKDYINEVEGLENKATYGTGSIKSSLVSEALRGINSTIIRVNLLTDGKAFLTNNKVSSFFASKLIKSKRDIYIITSTGSQNILTTSLKNALNMKGISIEDFNEHILSNIIEAGVGTRDAAVAAALSLVWDLYDQYDIRLPYLFGGQHAPSVWLAISNETGENLNRYPNTFYGVDANWGTSIVETQNGDVTYTNYGPDCSGFVSWVLHNAGFDDDHITDATGQGMLGAQYELGSSYVGQPGDLLSNSGHVLFIVGVDENVEVYYAAEAAGGADGVRISAVSFDSDKYTITDMSEYYENHAVYTNDDVDLFMEAYRAGYVLE